MNTYTSIAGLSVHAALREFIDNELLPLIEIENDRFWSGCARLIDDLSPVNRALLDKRSELQGQIDQWHLSHPGELFDATAYREFLLEIGYLVPEGAPFSISTSRVDAEIACIAGPQLVVPVNNARFAINAANARWVSLFDSLYGSDVIDECEGKAAGKTYNPERGKAVIDHAMRFLDIATPLGESSHDQAGTWTITDNGQLVISTRSGHTCSLADPEQYMGMRQHDDATIYLLHNNGLHIEVWVNANHPVGRDAPGNICDIVLESAITTIQDCEDSVAAVDAPDKALVYRNWLGLMRGTLTAQFEKSGRSQSRTMNPDRVYTRSEETQIRLPGNSVLLVRNVGHLMTNSAVLDRQDNEVFEGILDAIITTGCALAGRAREDMSPNSRNGSIYIVKPKMHGPEEAAFANTLFDRVEDLFGLERNTVKIGVMDEERRTTVNLGECIRAVKDRLVFINTGFLDRTGDEIHTSMEAGAVLPKNQIKNQPWIAAYEDWNVDIGLACGLKGKAQIGKGMWAMPDEMRAMMDTKQGHLEAGASCAWVPSPTAACLHAMHYHQINVSAVQDRLVRRKRASLNDILTPPLLPMGEQPGADTIQSELDNNAQGILGYVVRWIDQGVGCSKVPDIHNTGLMEDRATLRISSQHMANWLHHGVCSREQVLETLRRMAVVVDEQNASDPQYHPMSDDFDGSIAFRAACELVFEGRTQPSGYTEPILHRRRNALKNSS